MLVMMSIMMLMLIGDFCDVAAAGVAHLDEVDVADGRDVDGYCCAW